MTVFITLCVSCSALLIAVAWLLADTRAEKSQLRSSLPEELISHCHFTARRILAVAIAVVALATALVPLHSIDLSPLMLTISTFALLSLHNSRVVRAQYMVAWAALFVVPTAACSLCEGMTANIVWLVLFALQMLFSAFLFGIERRRYMLIVKVLGCEARDYRLGGSVILFALAIAIALIAWGVTLFGCYGSDIPRVVIHTSYYMVLAIYFRAQWRKSSVIDEITTDKHI